MKKNKDIMDRMIKKNNIKNAKERINSHVLYCVRADSGMSLMCNLTYFIENPTKENYKKHIKKMKQYIKRRT